MTPFATALAACFVAGTLLSLVGYVVRRPALPPRGSLLLPLALMAAVLVYSLAAAQVTRPGDDWAIAVIFIAAIAAVAWHLWLILRGPGRLVLVGYLMAGAAAWFYVAIRCALYVTKDTM